VVFVVNATGGFVKYFIAVTRPISMKGKVCYDLGWAITVLGSEALGACEFLQFGYYERLFGEGFAPELGRTRVLTSSRY
jgi:hypothetical protein